MRPPLHTHSTLACLLDADPLDALCPGVLRAPVPPSLQTCGCGSCSVVHMHVLRPAAFAERSSSSMSVGLAASASICMCGADVGMACRWLARAMQCPMSTWHMLNVSICRVEMGFAPHLA